MLAARRSVIPALLLISSAAGALELQVEAAWIKQLPATLPVRAGYMTLLNPHDRAVRIVAARSDDYAAVEFHRSVMRDGMMSMQKLEVLEVGAGASLRLEPGGLHLMLLQPVEPGKPGESRRISIEYEDGSLQELIFEIRD